MNNQVKKITQIKWFWQTIIAGVIGFSGLIFAGGKMVGSVQEKIDSLATKQEISEKYAKLDTIKEIKHTLELVKKTQFEQLLLIKEIHFELKAMNGKHKRK